MSNNVRTGFRYDYCTFLISFSSARQACGEVKYKFCLLIKRRILRLSSFAECNALICFPLEDLYPGLSYSKEKMSFSLL